ncbi:LacI family DNA-binding transcriptional regulator [Desertivirga arenae]|uniref:LacI family DNA-binding transcriptional regulator n=1 Tax=Desertivirga arenae TaxID=2810309 RepID=UPI00350FF05A
MKKLSIADIANQLNVSKSTVSFVLNGRAEEKRISKELVSRVEKFVKEVGYSPNPIARGLRTGKSHIIGLMVESISDPFFAQIAKLIEDRAYKKGYRILYCSTDNNTQKTRDLIDVFRERSVDGYIISPPVGVEKEIDALIKAGMPVVLFDRNLKELEVDYVEIDNEPSAFNATKMLVDQGFKDIAFITFSSSQSQMLGRLAGYRSAMSQEGLTDNVHEIDYNPDEEVMIATVQKYLSENKQLDAVLFGAIQAGSCGLKAINILNLKVPQDLAVVSFDDHDIFKLFAPPVTAIAQPIEAIADRVISLLLDRLEPGGKDAGPAKIILETELKLRKSHLSPVKKTIRSKKSG